MIKAIIFDCFGVLISDSLDVIVSEVRARQPEVAAEVVATINAVNKGLISRTESSQKVADLFGISVAAYKSRVRDGEIKNQQLLEYIIELRKTYKTGLLSNISSGGLESRFTPDELARHFDVVVVSGDIGYAKPEAQAYEITADRLGLRLDECVFIDDRTDYCQGAQSVGMTSILYTSFEQLQQDLSKAIK